jgi:oxygen-independent coproporphyrinogen-3 oxidase
MASLVKKYNIAVPRYTSYPTVPYWDNALWNEAAWLASVRRSYLESSKEGISLYIHLPFCENLCTYCGCTTRITKNHSVEEPYIAAVIKEWQMYCAILECKPKIREIHLGGGTPTFFSAKNLRILMDGILENAEIVQNTDFSFEAHPANTSFAHLETLYNSNFTRLSLGIQDFDPAVQKIINRRQTVEQVKQVTSEARELGYTSINFDLIYGLPLQKLSSVENTIQEVIKLMPDRIAYYSYAHVPWIKPGQRHFTESDLPEDEEKRALYEKGRELLLGAGYYDIGMDHFALKSDTLYKAAKSGRLHRNFMGYTHHYTQLLIGLGVSSISDSWYAFAQNTKTVETYLQELAEGRLPIVKGHMLSAEDLRIRRYILNIMCKGKTSISIGDPLFDHFMGRLVALEEDELIDIKGKWVQVTKTGRAYLRNICMCLDQRLWNKEPQTQIFSMSV